MRRVLISTIAAGALCAAGLCATAPASAQGFFMPGQGKAPAAGAPSRPATSRRVPALAPVQVPGPQIAAPLPGTDTPDQTPTIPEAEQQLPPAPDLPPLPKGTSPPAAVMGVIGVPDVMRNSSAAQQVEKTIGERREKLNEDAQKEQAAWRDMQQALVNDRGKLSPDQVRARERDLQERITNSQRQFRERGRIIQESAQYALSQIERTLVSVIRQVAESRGMNLVLHRQQVALNVNEFDITEEVGQQMNKVMPTVVIPPEGVAPPTVAASSTVPGAATPAKASVPAGKTPAKSP